MSWFQRDVITGPGPDTVGHDLWSARALLAAGDWRSAARRYHEALVRTGRDPGTDPGPVLDSVTIRVEYGRCLLALCRRAGDAPWGDALREFTAALSAAEDQGRELGLDTSRFGWRWIAPDCVRLAAPAWFAAAACVMELQDAAGRWADAVTAGNAALRVLGGLPSPGPADRERFTALTARMEAITHSARNPAVAASARMAAVGRPAVRPAPARVTGVDGIPAVDPDLVSIVRWTDWTELLDRR